MSKAKDYPKTLVVNALGHPAPRDTGTTVDPKSMTIQSHGKGLTVNEIMARFATTKTIPDRGIPPEFLDSTKVPDLFSALNMRVALNDYFLGLSSKVRVQFDNDPMKLVSFVNDPKNVNSALDMGLLKLNAFGIDAKAKWDAKQAALTAEKRKAFVADISQILKDSTPGGAK